MAQSKVAVLKTKPTTVLEDYSRLMHLAVYQQFLPKDKETALKTNISWEHFYPRLLYDSMAARWGHLYVAARRL
jgi:hypothetical protein